MTPAGTGPRARRARGRRRDTARLRAFILLSVLVLGGGLAVWLIVRADNSKRASSAAPSTCAGAPGSSASGLALASVQVRVLNATTRQGLAASVAVELRGRGYTVTGVGNDASTVPGPAVLRFGAAGAPAAKVLARVVPGLVSRPDKRAGAGVDLVLGNTFTRLSPVTASAGPAATGCPASAKPTKSPKRP